MEATAAITFGLALAGFAGGVVWKVASISVSLGKIVHRIETDEARDREERERSREKFAELYGATGEHESQLAALASEVKSVSSSCERIESKLDRLIEKS